MRIFQPSGHGLYPQLKTSRTMANVIPPSTGEHLNHSKKGNQGTRPPFLYQETWMFILYQSKILYHCRRVTQSEREIHKWEGGCVLGLRLDSREIVWKGWMSDQTPRAGDSDQPYCSIARMIGDESGERCSALGGSCFHEMMFWIFV